MYSLKVEGLKPGQVLALLDVLPPNATIAVINANNKDDEVTGATRRQDRLNKIGAATRAFKGRVEADDKVCLGETESRKGSALHYIKQTLEKMEATQGVGTVTRAELTEAIRKKYKDQSGAAISRALKHGQIVVA